MSISSTNLFEVLQLLADAAVHAEDSLLHTSTEGHGVEGELEGLVQGRRVSEQFVVCSLNEDHIHSWLKSLKRYRRIPTILPRVTRMSFYRHRHIFKLITQVFQLYL